MLFALAGTIFALWVLSVVTGHMYGGSVHLLVVLSVALVIVRLIKEEPVR